MIRFLEGGDTFAAFRTLSFVGMDKAAYIYTRHGTAIGADIYYSGMVLPRLQHHDDGTEQVKAKKWKAPTFIHRYYLALVRKHVALTTKRTFRFVLLIAFIIHISRRRPFRKTYLPFGVTTRFVHDCRFALFRRRAVLTNLGCCRTR